MGLVLFLEAVLVANRGPHQLSWYYKTIRQARTRVTHASSSGPAHENCHACRPRPSAPFPQVGVTADPDVHVRPVAWHDRFLILATDGVWEMIEPAEAVAIVQEFGDDV